MTLPCLKEKKVSLEGGGLKLIIFVNQYIPQFIMESNAPTIIITQKLGQPLQVEVEGVRGSSCTELTQPLNQLGVENIELKPEYHQEAQISTQTDAIVG
ncbi:MAG: DUF2997 domain-containing protein [Cyanobacteriota bacterium]|nr:DUF2997 domain-containing protein [Cyanobacteriota bacterium]